ncbi:formin-like protein 3 [Austrofundulus limnaeus]|uniref:Formin-like protein 3 n=1 Tax=Austrofundulus limnaeus TaxID=52670 RepID=A0A2I4BXX1_AUSLI|nr:PREDICTED: formin-like protein 3 [Austrofundulus limnaeus]
MGGNSPSHFSKEEEGGGITFVKGILLSDRVINRMKRSSEVNSPHIPPEPQTAAPSAVPVQPGEHLPPPAAPPPPPPQETRPTPPPVKPAHPVKPIPLSLPVKFPSLPSASVESAEQTPPPAAVSESVPSPPGVKSDVSPSATTFEPAAESAASSPPPAEPVPSSPVDSAPAEALTEPVLSSVAEEDPPAVDSGTPPPLLLAAAADLDAAAPCWSEKLLVVPSDAAVNETSAEGPSITHLPPEDESPAGAAGPPPAAGQTEVTIQATGHQLKSSAALPVCPESVEEELRQKIKEELQRSLEEEMKQKRQKLQQQLEEVRLQAQVEQQVSRTLKAEPAEEEKMKTEDETLMVQLYWMELKAQQLEEREKQMKERDVIFKEHSAKREAKFSEFCRVSAENFQRGKEETQRRFARFNTQPVCGHLQAQVLKCYKENPGKTLTCSGIASAYMQCVDNAKKVHIKT